MERPFSKSQQELLGARLVEGPAPIDADLARLRELLTYYGVVLEAASERIRSELAVKTTSRIKNTGTILEKLRRSGGSTLKSMQDLAGMRIVGGPDRREQDETVARVVELFQREGRAPKVIDRRANPVHGYSAVHVIVFPEGVPVEVQVRTAWQHEWAEVFEKLADAVGRGIRYGEEPTRKPFPPFSTAPVSASERDHLMRIWAAARDLEAAEHRANVATVEWALAVGRLIPTTELRMAEEDHDTNAVAEMHAEVDDALHELRRAIEDNARPQFTGL